MEFEWDLSKEIENLQKHGVDFMEAIETFSDPNGPVEGCQTFGSGDEVFLGRQIPERKSHHNAVYSTWGYHPNFWGSIMEKIREDLQ